MTVIVLEASWCTPIDRQWHTHWATHTLWVITSTVFSRSDRQQTVNETDTRTRCRCVWSYATWNISTCSRCSWPLLKPLKVFLVQFNHCDSYKGEALWWSWWEVCLLHLNSPSLSQSQSVYLNCNNETQPSKQSNNTGIWGADMVINGQHLWVNVCLASPLHVDSL